MSIRTFAVACALLLGMAVAPAAQARELSCKMTFQLSGWSVFYKTALGAQAHVHALAVAAGHRAAAGGGLTFGKTTIDHGIGKFSGVNSIADIKGHYANAEAHAGAEKSADAQVVTKGNVSLALSGKGRGWNLGVAFGAFIIE